MRFKISPRCVICEKTVKTDICIVLDKENDIYSSVCLDCRDRLYRGLKKLSPAWVDLLMPEVDRKEQLTPELECEVIDTKLATAYG